MLKNLIQSEVTLDNVANNTIYTDAFDMTNIATLSVQAIIDVPSAVVFASADIDATANTFTKTGSVLWTGVKGQFTTSNTLPSGISAMTNYWAIYISPGVYKFADTLNHALSGTAVDISTAGTGNQTFTPTSLTGGAMAFQRSNVVINSFASTDPTDWDDIDTETSVTTDGDVWFTKVGPEYRFFRVRSTVTTGSTEIKLEILGRGTDKY